MKYLSVHFTTKGTGFTNQHKASLVNLIHSEGQPITLVHAFADRRFLEKRNIPTDVLDFFDAFFPRQICFFDKNSSKPKRKEMVDFVIAKEGDFHFIGDHTAAGVKEEHDLVEGNTSNKRGISYFDLGDFSRVDDVFFH